MRRCSTTVGAALASVLFVGWTIAAMAQTDADGPVAVGECVGPHVQTVIQGDYRRGIPDRAIGDTPPILDAPAGQVVGQLAVWTSYTVVSLRHGYALLRGTRLSKPFAPGQTVGWVKASDVHDLALRNCN